MNTIHFGVGVAGPDYLSILCSHVHDTLNEARECYTEMPPSVRAIYQSCAKKYGLKLCIVRVEISEHPLNDA